MVEEELRAEDVTSIAENDDKLGDKYKEVTGNEGMVKEVLANPVTVRGLFEHITAIII
ncbi:hypothetical protein ASPVEDRAFT_42626 [Aspergillus versicolor CBS 583.65]|uniref:Uncharacterized protein n=1 Tax=Aspergillus versicolor CBS 583.65 TaxID=1036611 RepID=A0A1L9PNN4_ASPVE|nr:uncharacterized protein ASPVEDRAFT_42626 [Aspergillus versicolor CBS 583.65]OJJ03113.1 hypothetical protein ASPVEDRAFT_42626 [Aspergillus versicolor CBS 583.65]